MRCALCLHERELRLSHILPEFLYQDCYDSKHRFITVPTYEGSVPATEQKGYREYLLCHDCEQQFGEYERATSELLRRVQAEKCPPSNFIRISDWNYHKFKMFALSILWRCHVTSLGLYSNVRLGPHAEKIRVLLKNNDSGRLSQYRFFIIKTVDSEGKIPSVLIPPQRRIVQNISGYVMMAMGFTFCFTVASHKNPLSNMHYVGDDEDLIVPVLTQSTTEFINGLRALIPDQHLDNARINQIFGFPPRSSS